MTLKKTPVEKSVKIGEKKNQPGLWSDWFLNQVLLIWLPKRRDCDEFGDGLV